jgi:hypothetical protein
MFFMKKAVIIMCLIFAGCSICPKKDHFVPKDVSLKDNKIFVNGRIYAELLIIGKNSSYENCRGIAIHYLHTDRYEWIAPEEGWKLKKDNIIYEDIPKVIELWGDEPHGKYTILKGSNPTGGDMYHKLERRCLKGISNDGANISYSESGLFGPTYRKYRIRY